MKDKQNVNIGAVIETYNGDTKIGESSEKINVCTLNNVQPTITETSVTDIKAETIALTGNNQKLIINSSTARISAKITLLKKAELRSLTINGQALSTSDYTSTTSSGTTIIVINKLYTKVTDKTFNISVTDSRKYTDTIDLTPVTIDYIPLTINMTIKRPQPTTGEAVITFSGNYFNDSFGSVNNELTIQWYYKKRKEIEYTLGGIIDKVINENTYSNGTSAISLGKIFDYQSSYDFYLEVTDKLTTLNPKTSIAEGEPIYWWRRNFVNIMKNLLIKGVNILDKTDGVVLYDNANGTQGEISLEETLENFSEIKIDYYLNTASQGKLFKSTGRISIQENLNIVLDLNRPISGTQIQFVQELITISNGYLTRSQTVYITTNGNSFENFGSDTNFFITKIKGYR